MADQTNAEVSDERLWELLPCPRCGGSGDFEEPNPFFNPYDDDSAEDEFHKVACSACAGAGKLDVGPCPHCGSRDVFVERADLSSAYVMCNDCSCHGPIGSTAGDDMEEVPGGVEAIAAWNRRSVTSQASEGEVAGWFWRWASSDEWRPLSRSGTEAGRADFVRDQEKIAPVVVAQLYIASPSKRVVETGWLIEINNRSTGPTWFSMGETEDDGGHFTKDSLKALRFGRKEDAQAYIDDIGWTEAIPTEHEWSDPPQALQGGRS